MLESINSVEAAVNVTMEKYSYREEQRRQIYESLEKGDFSIITTDFGARQFVINYYQKLKQNERFSPFRDFATLTKFFDDVLSHYGIPKEDQRALGLLYNELLKYVNNSNQKEKLEKLLIEAANQYNMQVSHYAGVLRHIDFSMSDLTRREAAFLTTAFAAMEHQKHQVTEALSKYPAYQQQLLINLVNYSYYENDFSKSLEDQINEIKSSQK